MIWYATLVCLLEIPLGWNSKSYKIHEDQSTKAHKPGIAKEMLLWYESLLSICGKNSICEAPGVFPALSKHPTVFL